MTTRYNSTTQTSSLNNIDQEEERANSAISDLISSINILTARNDPLIGMIKSPKLLIKGLTELQSMVEMVDIKHSIVNQIKFLITNHARKQETQNTDNKSHFEGHMLHSVISGNPGTGKTTVGMILAKIWMALGFITKSVSTPSQSTPVLLTNTIVNTVNESYLKRICELEENQRNDHRRLDRIREMLTHHQVTSGEIRRKSIKLRPNSSKPIPINEIDKEWDSLIASTRDLRFGLDEIIREANTPDCGITGATATQVVTPAERPPPQIKINIDIHEDEDPKFVVAAREDLIAEYLGQTAPKTKKVLESARGGVLFIDEAYSLCNMDGGSKDKYGEECLTTINEYMSLHPDEIIIIFAGYKDKLMSSIFKAQPGLFRRCSWVFEIRDYTYRGLSKIFTRQLAKNSWTVSKDINVEKILEENKSIIQDGGGGTEKLAFFVKIEYGNSKFNETVNGTNVVHDSIITDPMIEAALVEMHKNVNNFVTALPPPPDHMYL